MTYKTGKVYKIIHNQSNVVYVGSTLNKRLRERWQQHKNDFKSYSEGNKRRYCSIYSYFEEFGIENFKMILIKEYQVLDKKHLHVYETLWIKKLKPINEVQPISLYSLCKKEYEKIHCKKWYENNKEKVAKRKKEYYENNKEAIAKRMKEYCQNNKEAIAKKKKEYREKNKEKTSKRNKEYYENNKEKLKEKVKCDCGSEVRKDNLRRHLKSKKHIDYINHN